MIINFNGMESFKIQTGNFILAFNPISKKSKFKPARFGADVVCVSAQHPNFNGVEQSEAKNKKSFVIDSPGEYEISGVFIKGFPIPTTYAGKECINTIFSISLEKMNIGFLGILNSNGIDGELRESLNSIDILFVPIGGGDVLSADEAYKLSVKLGAKIIIPMHYGKTDLPNEAEEKNALKSFLKAGGVEDLKTLEKLTIKKNDLAEKQVEIAVLQANN